MRSILELQHITHSFSRSKPVLNDINLKLSPHQVYTLMGANGSGKTTLFNVIGGYIRPERGKILLKDEDITFLQPSRINQLGVGRTFQQPRIIKQLTLKENIIFAMRHNPTDVWYQALLPKFVFNRQIRDLEEKAQLVLEQFLLQDIADDLAETISYGQQKLLNLACTIANGGQLLLLDEPLAGLSPLHNRKICDLLIRLKSDGKTILMIEHHQAVTKDITDQYLLLDKHGLSNHASFGSVQLNIADGRLT